MADVERPERQWEDFQRIDWEIGDELKDPENTVYSVSVYYGDPESWLEKFNDLLAEPAIEDVAGFSLGQSETEDDVCKAPVEPLLALIDARELLKGLRAFKIGMLERDQCELSWIKIGNLNPFLSAYSNLELLHIKGSGELSFGELNMPELRSLTIVTGGLKSEVVRQILSGHLPKLEHLELYLGESSYGSTVGIEDFAPLLSGRLFPKLKYLGIKNSPFQDEIAQVLATSPILERIETLDLSDGILTDAGAQALLDSPLILQLKNLDIIHHWMSDEMVAKLEALPIEVNNQLCG